MFAIKKTRHHLKIFFIKFYNIFNYNNNNTFLVGLYLKLESSSACLPKFFCTFRKCEEEKNNECRTQQRRWYYAQIS